MTKCRACDTFIIKFFSLGKMPPVNAFLTEKELGTEKKYDLSIGFCPQCYLVQLIHEVDPTKLFTKYLYFSSVTQSIIDHSKKTADHLCSNLGLGKNSLVIELGSNDGVNLQFYKKRGIKILGIDPAKNIAAEANKKGIPTIAQFFTTSLARKLVHKRQKADLIYGANVFAHIPSILDVARGMKMLLTDNGTAVLESPYIGGLLENKFDTIYHEHVFYYSLIALQNLFKQVKMEIYDVEFVEMQGGSLRIYVSNMGKHKVLQNVKELEQNEHAQQLDKLKTYKKINDNVQKLKDNLIHLLSRIKSENKKIVAYGAPAKGVILLNYFDISKFIDYLVDKSPAKQGRFIPGVHLKIFPIEKIKTEKPDYILLLSWNIAEEIIRQLSQFHKQGGKFIIPIPQIKIL